MYFLFHIAEFSLPLKEFDWLKFNVNQTGFYLVNYDKDDWKKLSDVLLNNHEVFHQHNFFLFI